MARPTLESHWPEGDALVDEARAVVATLAGVLSHASFFTSEDIAAVEAAGKDIERRLYRNELVVVVIGERSSGKATFLNALAGVRILGLTEERPDTVTFLRRGEALDFRARFANGAEEDFATAVPDETPALLGQLEPIEAALLAADADRGHAEREAATAARALAKDESALVEAGRAVDRAHDDVSRLQRATREAKDEVKRLEDAVGEAYRALPTVVRTRPPLWAIGAWALRGVVLLFVGQRARSHEELQRQHAEAIAKAYATRIAAGAAVEVLRAAEARANKLRAPVETARDRRDHHERQLGETEGNLADLFTDATRLREEVARHQDERRRRFFERLAVLCDGGAQGNEVLELEIDVPSDLLPANTVVVGVPGILAEGAATREHAWKVIREEADACLVLAEMQMQKGLGFTRKFLQLIREVVPHVVLVMTKMDKAFLEAMRKRQGEPWQQVEELRREGTTRFARDVGRDPSTVLSVAVSSESALKPGAASGLGRRFATETEKMFRLLRHEGGLMLGKRCAETVRRCIPQVAAARAYATRKLEARAASLEARRVPEPAGFRAEQLEAVQVDIDRAAALATGAALELFRDRVRLVRIHGRERLAACEGGAALRKEAERLDGVVRPVLEKANADAGALVVPLVDRAVRAIEGRILESLRQRYGAGDGFARPSSWPFALPPFAAEGASPVALARVAARATTWFALARVILALLGMALGAAAGTLLPARLSLELPAAVLPIYLTAAGAAAGALLALAARFPRARAKCLDALEAGLCRSEDAFVERVRALKLSVAAAIRGHVERSTTTAFDHYAKVVVEPLDAERVAIDRDLERANDLEALRERLTRHEQSLTLLHQRALEVSTGLSR